ALTGAVAIRFIEEKISLNKKIMTLLKAKDPLTAVERLLEDKATLEKKLGQLERKALAALADQLIADAVSIPLAGPDAKVSRDAGAQPINFIAAVVDVNDMDSLKKLCFEISRRLPYYVTLVCADIGGKAGVALGIDPELISR